jgi:cellulose synthase/poly-beta-1,6-N-acetylglucosamine synthase-like glycosyltransferase
MWTHWLILALYFSALGGLGVWGLHRVVLLVWLRREGASDHPQTQPTTETPRVLVQLPVFNEPLVIARIIDAAARLDWPRLEIQVLDDSTDGTTALAAARVQTWCQAGVRISHIRRTERTGFKAGALAHGLSLSSAEFVAIFDADFVPDPDFLTQMMPELRDPQVGMVQARWGHINRMDSWLTRIQAMLLDGHFVIEHTARFRAGCFFNFNGTAGIWRTQAIDEAGGWAHDTITEDLDLSYRAQLAGWRFVYRDDVVAPAEVPTTMRAFLTQQHRWAKGTTQTARKLVGRIALAPIPWRVRLEAINHLCMVSAYPMALMLAVLLPPSIVAREALFSSGLALLDITAVLATTGTICGFYAVVLHRSGLSVAKRIWDIPLAMALGVGCSASQSLAVFEGLVSKDATFIRTPKQGEGRAAVARAKPTRVLLTTVMALYYLYALQWAVVSGRWASLPFMSLFGLGFILVSLSQWLEKTHTGEAAALDVAPATK